VPTNEGRIAPAEQQDGNRELIAGAPELLEALNALLHVVGELPITFLTREFYDAMHAAHATISKVEGSCTDGV
jgi:hypothetical protein